MLDAYFFIGIGLIILLFFVGWQKKSLAFLIPCCVLAILLGGVVLGQGVERPTLIVKQVVDGNIQYSIQNQYVTSSHDAVLLFLGWFLMVSGAIGTVWLAGQVLINGRAI